MTIISRREFDQTKDRAIEAAADGPVFITDQGQPAYVLMTVDAYHRLSKQATSIGEAFYVPGIDEIEFDIPKLDDTGIKPVDLS